MGSAVGHREQHDRAATVARLQALGAVCQPQYALPGVETYFAGAANVWVIVRKLSPERFAFEFFTACPC